MPVRGGRYELIRSIASGGMATVHLGRALGEGGFERLVAIKVMHAHLAEEPEFVAMFLDEARLAARIRHPNVVGTIDIQRDEQGLILVMDYVEGPSLQRVLRAFAKKHNGGPPIDVGLRIFVDALSGLHAAHELRGADGEPLNLVHRDVTPQNILIGVDGIAQITDFGVARAESRLQTTRAGVVKGKICYMAPEQIRSEPIDRRTDVYAAGVVLWEILTGQRLIRGDNDGAQMEKILRGQHPTPSEVSPTVPEAISAACMRALAAAPADRYPTAAAFAEAVETAAAGAGVGIASPRVLSTFVKDLAIERAAGAPATLASSSKSLDAPSPATRPLEQAVAAATVAQSPGPLPESTHAAVLAPSSPAAPRRSSALRWVGACAFVLVAGAGWFLFTRGPLRLSWRDAPASLTASAAPRPEPLPAGASTSGASASPEPAAPTGAATAALPAATARAESPKAPATTAPVAASATTAPPSHPVPAQRGERRRPEASPTSFRPKDL